MTNSRPDIGSPAWPTTFERDYDDIVEYVEADPDEPAARTLYTVTSQKDREATYARHFASEYDEFGSGDGLVDYGDMRALPFWVDVDLADEVKPRRDDLSPNERVTIETAFERIIEEIAVVYGPRVDSSEIPALDSGGGMYPWGPGATTLPIAEHFEDDTGSYLDARVHIFEELANRMNAYLQGDEQYYSTEGEGASAAEGHGFEGIIPRLEADHPAAADLLDVDGVLNNNRQSKAPLSIHKRHDIVVTPLRDSAGENRLLADAHQRRGRRPDQPDGRRSRPDHRC